MVYYIVLIYYFKNILSLVFFILKTFCSTLNLWIGEFVFWCHEQVTCQKISFLKKSSGKMIFFQSLRMWLIFSETKKTLTDSNRLHTTYFNKGHLEFNFSFHCAILLMASFIRKYLNNKRGKKSFQTGS